MRILVVEDSEVNREFLLGLLAGYGDCLAAECGEDALALVARSYERDEPLDLVFMDFRLPGMDGLQTIEKIRHLEESLGIPSPRQMKILVVSAMDDDQMAQRAFFQGHALAVLPKPLRLDTVRREMDKLGYPSPKARATRTSSPRER